MSYQWGTAQFENKTTWLVQSCTEDKSSNEAMALDNSGEPVDIHFYQRVNSFSIEVIIPAEESSYPEIGDVMTYGGVKFFVAGVTKTRSNQDYTKYSLSARRFITAGLPA